VVAPGPPRSPIIVGFEADYPPHAFDEQGQPTGFSLDLSRAIADMMGLSVQIRMGPWHDIREALASGEIDAIAGIYYSEERGRTFAFSPPYALTHHVAFARQGIPPLASEDDLRVSGGQPLSQYGGRN
jgi:polar amino acid transport system substrate-binding protein